MGCVFEHTFEGFEHDAVVAVDVDAVDSRGAGNCEGRNTTKSAVVKPRTALGRESVPLSRKKFSLKVEGCTPDVKTVYLFIE